MTCVMKAIELLSLSIIKNDLRILCNNIKNYNIMTLKRKLSEYMDSLTLVEAPLSKKSKKQFCSVHCQTEEKIYTEKDIKEMIANYVNYVNNNQYSKIEPSTLIESF